MAGAMPAPITPQQLHVPGEQPHVPGCRTTALFPGAFRPPHANHYEVVRDLAEREDVDDVVVIISNRLRPVPGTEDVLDVDVARRVWEIYLAGHPHVRVEVAESSGVAHAIGYLDAARPGERLLFIVGEKDLATRGRFGKLSAHARADVSATVVRGAPNVCQVNATRLRMLLAPDGVGSKAAFFGGLPQHLSADEKAEVWAVCRAATVPRAEAVARRIEAVLHGRGVSVSRASIEPASAPKSDQVFRVLAPDGQVSYVKYANDAVAADSPDATGRKPRNRLKTERMALKWVRGHVRSPVEIPTVTLFDARTRTLALGEVCGGGRRLSQQLSTGVIALDTARAVGAFLGAVHSAPAPRRAFRDAAWRDLHQWRTRLARLTTDLIGSSFGVNADSNLRTLRHRASRATTPGFHHLDLTTGNVIVNDSRVGVIDFESSSAVGDPAYDLGTWLGSYVLASLLVPGPGQSATVRSQVRVALAATIEAYRSAVGTKACAEVSARACGFAGAVILRGDHRRTPADDADAARRVRLGCALLSTDLVSLPSATSSVLEAP